MRSLFFCGVIIALNQEGTEEGEVQPCLFNFAKWIVVGSDFIGVLHLEDGRQDSHLMVNILESRPVYCGHGASRTAWPSFIGRHSATPASDWFNPDG